MKILLMTLVLVSCMVKNNDSEPLYKSGECFTHIFGEVEGRASITVREIVKIIDIENELYYVYFDRYMSQKYDYKFFKVTPVEYIDKMRRNYCESFREEIWEECKTNPDRQKMSEPVSCDHPVIEDYGMEK